MQTGLPVEQLIDPVLQTAGLHTAPAAQATQAPALLQTPPGHAVPAARLPESVHTGAPEAHTNEAVRHGLLEVQDAPAMHGTHVPEPLQTPPGHIAPAA